MDSNPEPKVYLTDLFNKIKNKDFSSPPNYLNGLDTNNSNISQNNKTNLQKILKITKYFLISPLEIIYKEQHGIFTSTTNEREKCPICLCEFYDDIIPDDTKNIDLKDLSSYMTHEIDTIKLFRCEDHFYHIECLLNLIQQKTGFKCAVCQKQYGIIIGNMPKGTMTVKINNNLKCQGFPNCSTINIYYHFNSGFMDGKKYTGTSRSCYIPNTKNGRILLGLLKISFDRLLTFTIGTSVTTGQKDCVVWNGIHHKTSTYGGATSYGYPDDTYFNRVCEELASKGVNKDDFEEKELEFLGLSLIYGK